MKDASLVQVTKLFIFSAVSKSTLIYMTLYICNFIVLCYSTGGTCLYSTGCGGSGCVIDCC